ncbi:MAG: phage portal protein [Sarcina sp.]
MFGLGKPLKSEEAMSIEEWIDEELKEFTISKRRAWMGVGQRYYEVENDILNRKIFIETEANGREEDESKPNNRLAHAHYKNSVDEKVNYIFGKQYTIDCKNEEYIKNINEALGKYFLDTFNELAYDASNKGIGWLQVYFNEKGQFDTMVIPPEECCPIWKDRKHTILQAMIRFYNQIVYEGKNKKEVMKIEYYTDDTVEYFIKENGKIILDSEMYLNVTGPFGHFKKGNEAMSFGRVPFIAFKNNRIEAPDIKFVKSLQDNYDLSRSDVANFIEEVKNLIYVLKGYGGEDLGQFIKELNYYRAIKIDDPTDGGVDTLNPKLDIIAAKEHWEQLKRDLIENGQGVNKDLDKFGGSPSGIALKFLYAALDLKCNALEVNFKKAFEELLYFINIYLKESSSFICNDCVEIIFNRDIQINETEAIDNCSKSKGIISDKTIIANHPFVKDVEEEIARIEEEQEQEINSFSLDTVPVGELESGE